VVAKECSGFVPTNVPPYCTITSSNLAAIPKDSRIVYLDPAGLGTAAGGSVVLDPPGPGNNEAFGTCFLGGSPMHCEFSGGTGTFTGSTPVLWSQSPIKGRQRAVALGWDIQLHPALS
jgi:hypothetical protein